MIEKYAGIELHMDSEQTGAAAYGIIHLKKSLSGMEMVTPGKRLFAGTCLASIKAGEIADSGLLCLARESGAYSFGEIAKNEYALIGYDDTGLMYGCFELADMLECGMELSSIGKTAEKPFMKVRGIFTFLHNSDLEAEWFYSEEFWNDYFDMLAYNRYNSFNLVFSHQTNYLTPMFSYFIKVEEHPEVYPVDAAAEDIERNYKMLKYITGAAEKRGIDFILGIWQVITWKGDGTEWAPPQINKVAGLNPDNITSYTYHALKKLLKEFKSIKGIQIRANGESGISEEEQTEFFTKTFFKAINECGRSVITDLRGWMARKETVDNAIKYCPDLRISAKYWAEYLGGPYQPAKISPGYSYSDFLEQPLKYDFIWQVWSLGSPRLLLWGDPEYVSRMVDTFCLGGGTGFEINPHLAQKGYGNDSGYWRIFKNREDEYYKWEYERYWLFYRLFGRLSYNPSAAEKIWRKELVQRFGIEYADPVLESYKSASRIITFIVQYALSDPNMYIWPEMDTGGLLEYYLDTPTSDKCSINTIKAYVAEYLGKEISGKLSPDEASGYLAELAHEIFCNTRLIEKDMSLKYNKELQSSLIDFKTLAHLAMFHSHKILAAKNLALYTATRDVSCLMECHKLISRTLVHWEQIISITQNMYFENMITSPLDFGTWKKKLQLVYEDVNRVAELLRLFECYENYSYGYDFGAEGTAPIWEWIKLPIFNNCTTEKGFIGVSDISIYSRDKGFGFESIEGINPVKAPRVRLNDKHLDNIRRDTHVKLGSESYASYRNMLYSDYVCGSGQAAFLMDIENGEYEITLVMADHSERSRAHGPMSISICETLLPNISVMPLEVVEKKARVNITTGRIKIDFSCDEGADWFISAIVVKPAAPVIRYVPAYFLDREGSSILKATITCPDIISSVELLVKAGGPDYIPMEMRSEEKFIYWADIKGIIPDDCNEIKYFIKAVSKKGFDVRTEEVVVSVRDRKGSFVADHNPVRICREGNSIDIKLHVKASNKLEKVKMYYSYVNQYSELLSADMKEENGVYMACIPDSYIDKKWDILYYFEIVDIYGEGMIYPDFRVRTPYFILEVIR